MSWKASGFVKEQRKAPDGTPYTRDQKFLLLILADYHQTNKRASFPSVPLLAEDALMSERYARSLIRELEQHLALVQIQTGAGRGAIAEYKFVGLDVTVEDAKALLEEKKGAQCAPLIQEEGGTEGGTEKGQRGHEKGAKGAQDDTAIRNSRGTVEPVNSNQPEPNQNPDEFNAAEMARIVCLGMNISGQSMMIMARDAIENVMREKHYTAERAGPFLVEQWAAYRTSPRGGGPYGLSKRRWLEEGSYLDGPEQWEERGDTGQKQADAIRKAAAAVAGGCPN